MKRSAQWTRQPKHDLQFFRELGIQVIVSGLIELKRVFLGYITTQIETLRNERTNLTTTETTYYKDKARAAIVQIDPSQRRLEAAEQWREPSPTHMKRCRT